MMLEWPGIAIDIGDPRQQVIPTKTMLVGPITGGMRMGECYPNTQNCHPNGEY
jgi:hypothetical protein